MFDKNSYDPPVEWYKDRLSLCFTEEGFQTVDLFSNSLDETIEIGTVYGPIFSGKKATLGGVAPKRTGKTTFFESVFNACNDMEVLEPKESQRFAGVSSAFGRVCIVDVIDLFALSDSRPTLENPVFDRMLQEIEGENDIVAVEHPFVGLFPRGFESMTRTYDFGGTKRMLSISTACSLTSSEEYKAFLENSKKFTP